MQLCVCQVEMETKVQPHCVNILDLQCVKVHELVEGGVDSHKNTLYKLLQQRGFIGRLLLSM